MKKPLSLMLIALFILIGTGCSGTFSLTKKYNSWHRGFENPWTDEAVFLGSIILPVYFVTTLGDAIIFNSLEFWGEENPVKSTSIMQDDVTLTRQTDGTLSVESEQASFTLIPTASGVAALDADGFVQFTAKMGADGQGYVYDAAGCPVRTL